jgi:O-6-methylguanine DNA methyltransferase
MGCWIHLEPQPEFSIFLAATDHGLCRLSIGLSLGDFLAQLTSTTNKIEWKQQDHPVLYSATLELSEYFQGNLKMFQVPLDLRGTAFQKRVWETLLRIPYGETRSYADIAKAVGSPRAVRAVGGANAANPVPIIVPCHRVIASDGSLGGYGAGLDCKRHLLALEAGRA